MTVRAKFKVACVTNTDCGAGSVTDTVELTAVYGPGNESWSKWTPSGTIKMTITNPAALEAFEPGTFVYVDFSPAE